MKKILIVNNNMDVGGIQKSLLNLIVELYDEYDISLLLFSSSGQLFKLLPQNVKVINTASRYQMLGLNRKELAKKPFLFVLKFILKMLTRLSTRRLAMRFLGVGVKKIKGYDVVISYSHLPSSRMFINGCGDFVLDKTVAKNKICMIHCDYVNSGYISRDNNYEYLEFDNIACCSKSVKDRFVIGSGISENNISVLKNFFDTKILDLSLINPIVYDDKYINVISVSRLSEEKGIYRAICCLNRSQRKDIRYYILGGGPEYDKLKNLITSCGLDDFVFLLGEHSNPYRHMINADYLLVPSFHEAAPMVFDEAKCLGLAVLSTDTTSAREVLTGENDYVFSSDEDTITEMFLSLKKSYKKKKVGVNNELQKKQFKELIDKE